MHVASQNGHFDVIMLLLEANADVNIKTNVSLVDCVTIHSVCVCVLSSLSMNRYTLSMSCIYSLLTIEQPDSSPHSQ